MSEKSTKELADILEKHIYRSLTSIVRIIRRA